MSRARLTQLSGLVALTALGGCLGDPSPRPSPDFPAAAFPAWSESDGAYRFYPGDSFRLDVRTAPELSADLTIGPDGRVTPPVIGPVMAAARTAAELQASLEAAYSSELVDPALTITPTAYGSQKIFVGGEVRQPGVFALPGEIDPLQAILLAGGWTDKGRPTHVIVMRRAPGGQLQSRIIDVKHGLARQSLDEIGPLQRFDVVYVTRKPIADQNLFMKQWIRNALPIDFFLVYDIGRD
jgi:protein involved in polysaccharide export with SLBB domain